MDVASIVYQELNVEEVDLAIEELSTVPRSGVREFGEMVARPGVVKRFDVGTLGLVL